MYLDAGSGSMLVSAIVAGAAGVGVVGKVGMRKVTGVFKKNKGDDTPQTQAADTTEQQ
ncbi:MAG TPA: hypothetical protein VNA20_11300 [Frankiaceae bacterium]|nr:hypothetical protein [Frankiaceae bacterium]